MATKKMSKQELEWQADSDAETMARYEEIMADKARRNAAIAAAKEKADNLDKRVAAMKKVSKTKKK